MWCGVASQNRQVVTYNQQSHFFMNMQNNAEFGNPYVARRVFLGGRYAAGDFGYGDAYALGLARAWFEVPVHLPPGWDEMPFPDLEAPRVPVHERAGPRNHVARYMFLRRERRERRRLEREEFQEVEQAHRQLLHRIEGAERGPVQALQAAEAARVPGHEYAQQRRRFADEERRARIALAGEADDEFAGLQHLEQQRRYAAGHRLRAAVNQLAYEEEERRERIVADEDVAFAYLLRQAAAGRPRNRNLGEIEVLRGFVACTGAELFPGGRMRAYTTSRVSYGTYDVQPLLPFWYARLTGPVAYWSAEAEFSLRPGDAVYSRVQGTPVCGRYLNGSRDLSVVHAVGDRWHEFPVRYEEHIIDGDKWQLLRVCPSGTLDFLSVDVDASSWRTAVPGPINAEGIVARLEVQAGLDRETAVRVGYEIVAERIPACDVAGLNEVKLSMLKRPAPSDPCTVARLLEAERTRVGHAYASDPPY